MDNKILIQALALANEDFYVFPLAEGTKRPPKGHHGEREATTDPKKIKLWFTSTRYNIAVNLAKSGLAVIDLDNHQQGVNGVNNWGAYINQHGDKKDLHTHTEGTPNNGLHLFYRYIGRRDNMTVQLLPGVELLLGKATIYPSSLSNGQYRPVRNSYQQFSRENIQPLPKYVLDLAAETQRKQQAQPFHHYASTHGKMWTGKILDSLVTGVPKGRRNVFMTKLCGQMVHAGADDRNMWELMKYANTHNQPPLEEKELEEIVKSIIRKDMGR